MLWRSPDSTSLASCGRRFDPVRLACGSPGAHGYRKPRNELVRSEALDGGLHEQRCSECSAVVAKPADDLHPER